MVLGGREKTTFENHELLIRYSMLRVSKNKNKKLRLPVCQPPLKKVTVRPSHLTTPIDTVFFEPSPPHSAQWCNYLVQQEMAENGITVERMMTFILVAKVFLKG